MPVDPKLGEQYLVGKMKLTVHKLDEDGLTAWLKLESGGMLRLPIDMLTPICERDATEPELKPEPEPEHHARHATVATFEELRERLRALIDDAIVLRKASAFHKSEMRGLMVNQRRLRSQNTKTFERLFSTARRLARVNGASFTYAPGVAAKPTSDELVQGSLVQLRAKLAPAR